MKAGTSDKRLRKLARELGVCLLLSDGRFTNGEEDGVVPEPFRPATVFVHSEDELDCAAERLAQICLRLALTGAQLILLEDDELERKLRRRLILLRRRGGFDAAPRTATALFAALKLRHYSRQGR